MARLLLLLAMLGAAAGAWAHEVRPALLRITEVSPGQVDILWKRPAADRRLVGLTPHFNSQPLADPTGMVVTPQAETRVWRGVELMLEGATIHIDGLERTITDVLLVVERLDGSALTTVLKPQASDFVVGSQKPLDTAASYLSLGVGHILLGPDHLLFLVGLLLLLNGPLVLVKAITSFTVAHSITLALITLGHIQPNVALVEALVALSVVVVAVEAMRLYRGRPSLLQGHPWLIAFAFGLLHGSAFGGELVEIGLPPEHLVTALLLFNLGIEVGQLLFIAVLLGLAWLARAPLASLPAWTRQAPAYAVGCFGAFWFFERLGEVFPV